MLGVAVGEDGEIKLQVCVTCKQTSKRMLRSQAGGDCISWACEGGCSDGDNGILPRSTVQSANARIRVHGAFSWASIIPVPEPWTWEPEGRIRLLIGFPG